MHLLRGRRAWMVGAVLGYALLALAWSAAAAPRASPRATDPAPKGVSEPTYSSPIALSADRNFVWVVNPDDDSVSVIRADTDVVVARIANVGDEPQSVAVHPGGQLAFVANAASNNVAVIRVSSTSPFTAAVIQRFTTGAEPWNVIVTPDGGRVFVANSAQDTITVLRADTANPSIVGNIDLRTSACNAGDQSRHFQPRGMAVTASSDRLYVTRFLSFTQPGGTQADNDGKVGLVCRIDLPPTITTLPTQFTPIALAPRPSGFPPNVNEPAYPNQLQSIVIRGDSAYLPNIAAAPAAPLIFNADTHAFVNRISGVNLPTVTQTDEGAINLHLGARNPEPGKTKLFFANPWAIAFTSQSGPGNAYVVSAGSDLLVKLNVDATGVLSFTVDTDTTRYIDLHDPNNAATSGANAAKNPLGIVIRSISPTDVKAYVMNYISRNVSVVNLATDSVQKVIQLSALPSPGSDEEVLLVGAEMFFSARGVFNGGKFDRLSSEGWQNCASCHFAGLTDGNVWSFAAGPRKSVPMNGTWSPHNPDDQRVLNYSAIFDEVQDFEANIRNVSGPGNLPGTNPPQLDPNHGLLIGDNGDINAAPSVVNAFVRPNAGRPQLTVTLPGSSVAVPALDALKEWVRFAIRTPNGALTTAELARDPPGAINLPNTSTVGGLDPAEVALGRRLFFRAGCQLCHGGTKWSNSTKDFVSPPASFEIATETNPPPPPGVTPVGAQYLNRFLRNIGSFGLGTPANPIGGNIGAAEGSAAGQAALGADHNADGKGVGYNVPSLLGIWSLPPYYHNGACETLECVLSNVTHRTARGTRPDVLVSQADRARVVAFLRSLDADTPFPTNLRLERHDIFADPPVVFQGRQVTIAANLSLFGTRADLQDLAGASPLRVRFAGPGLNAEVDVPLARFTQDFSTAVVSTTWNVPADITIATVEVTIDTADAVAEANEEDNRTARRFLVRLPPPDTTPPTVDSTLISDDDPFDDNDPIATSRNVRVKFRATNTPSPGGGPTSELDSFCIVRYTFSSALRRWVESPCSFQPLPAPAGDGSFTVNAVLPPREGAVYAFVWVRDAAGNVSRRPGFDFISFVPPPDVGINVRRNEVRVFRIRLDAGQALSMTFDPLFGDVDVAVFDRNGTRLQVSANNGDAAETVALAAAANDTVFHVEVRAVVNSRFTIGTSKSAAEAAAAEGAVPDKAELPETPINLGPPPTQAAFEEIVDLFLPTVGR
ncbi:MAG TPA: YncE family protein [Roseiflexaceae bacterium]|nr:YncE family protein [Roseiflexaceae bacterium]